MPNPIRPWAEVEKRAVIEAYVLCSTNGVVAAKALGIGTATLYRKLKSYGINVTNRKQVGLGWRKRSKMQALKCYVQVTAGIMLGETDPEWTKRWEWVINAKKFERVNNTLYTPSAEVRTEEVLLAVHQLWDEATEYARELQNPGFVNWVKLEWVWM